MKDLNRVIILENTEITGRYDIWANGILSETMSLHTYKRKNRFTSVEKYNML